AQSLYAISSSSLKESSALITVRVIVRGDSRHIDDDQWMQSVIRGVNTQNRVKNYDFRANDPEQAELQRQFKEQFVFYERKRGEWKEHRTDPKYKGFVRIPMSVLGQILTAIKDDDGQGVLLVKRGTELIFEDRIYSHLFPSRSKVASRFKRMYFAYRLFRLLKQCNLGCKDRKEFRKRRHAFWNVLWLTHLILKPTFAKCQLSTDEIRTLFDEFEGRSLRGRCARKAIKQISKEVWRAYIEGRMSDRERWTANNFFKQSYGMKVVQRLALHKARKAVIPMSRLLLDYK